MGSSSPCTCNVRVCNYHKKGGYGFDTEKEVINAKTQVDDLKNTLSAFMNDETHSAKYFKPVESQTAFNNLRNAIETAVPIDGLTMDPFCVNITDSYKNITENTVSEGYTLIKPKPDICSVLTCIVIIIVLFAFACFVIYRYITCPCRKRHENDLKEANRRR